MVFFFLTLLVPPKCCREKNSQCRRERHQLCQLEGRGEDLIQGISGLLFHGLSAMSIGIHRDLDAAVAHENRTTMILT